MLSNEEVYAQEGFNNKDKEIENIYKKGIEIFKQNHLHQTQVATSDNSEHQFNLSNTANQEKVASSETDLLFQTAITLKKDDVQHIYEAYRIIFREFKLMNEKVKEQYQTISELETFIKMSLISQNAEFRNKITKERISQIWADIKQEHEILFVVDLMKQNQNIHYEQPIVNQEEQIQASLRNDFLQKIEKKSNKIQKNLKKIHTYLLQMNKKLEQIKKPLNPAQLSSVQKLTDFLNSQSGQNLKAYDSQIYSQTKQITKVFSQLQMGCQQIMNVNQ